MYTGIIPFRYSLVYLLPFFLIPMYGIRFDMVTKSFVLLALVIIVSGIVNGSDIMEILIFFRYLIIPFSMYYLAIIHIRGKNIVKLIKLSIFVAMIQLPVVIIQRLFYRQLIPLSAVDVIPMDFNFGTFFIKNDPAMSMFLIGVILFVLFDNKNNYFIKRRHLIAVWLTITILLANAIITHFIIIGIWGYYLLRSISVKRLSQVLAAGMIVVGTFYYSGHLDDWILRIKAAASTIEIVDIEKSEDLFFQGGYARAAAIIYYINQPIKILGDGPSKYWSPITGYILGNQGHAFTFYSEVGIIGLLLSYWILFQMTRWKWRSSSAIAKPYFVSIVALTATTQVIMDPAIILAYNIFLSTNLISQNIGRRHYQKKPNGQLLGAGQ